MTINEGDQVIFNLPEQLRFRTSYDINVYNPDNQIVGLAQIDPEKNRVIVYNFTGDESVNDYTLQDFVKVGIYEDFVIDFGSMEL